MWTMLRHFSPARDVRQVNVQAIAAKRDLRSNDGMTRTPAEDTELPNQGTSVEAVVFRDGHR
jgi:hypothetical protein